MPPPFDGIGAKNATAIISPQHPQRLAFNTWVSSTTAFPARNLKADLVETFTQDGQSKGTRPQDSATSFFFKPQGGSLIMITPVIQGVDEDQMNVEVHLWEEGWSNLPGFEFTKQWTPQFLCEVQCLAGTKTGAAGGIVPAGALYCDVLSFPTSQAADDAGLLPLQTRLMQTATPGNTVARIAIDYVGSPLVEIRLKVSTAGDLANALIKTV